VVAGFLCAYVPAEPRQFVTTGILIPADVYGRHLAMPATSGPYVHEPAASAPPVAALIRAALGRAVPVLLDIPSIGVHTTVISVGLNADGTVALPPAGPTEAPPSLP
jgi:hypothetical protein